MKSLFAFATLLVASCTVLGVGARREVASANSAIEARLVVPVRAIRVGRTPTVDSCGNTIDNGFCVCNDFSARSSFEENSVLHQPITHLRILTDDSGLQLLEGEYATQFACGEEIPLTPHGREIEAQV